MKNETTVSFHFATNNLRLKKRYDRYKLRSAILYGGTVTDRILLESYLKSEFLKAYTLWISNFGARIVHHRSNHRCFQIFTLKDVHYGIVYN